MSSGNLKTMAAGDCFWIAVVVAVVLHLGLALTLWIAPLKSVETSALSVEFCTIWDESATPDRLPPVVAVPLTSLPPVETTASPPPATEVIQPASADATARPTPEHTQRSASTNPAVGIRGGRKITDATAVFFDVPARGGRIIYVIDRSTSMGLTGALNTAKRELCESIRELPDNASFQVIAYNRAAEPLPIARNSGLAPATLENKQRAHQLIDALSAEGGSAHLTALKQALGLRPDAIYFLSDANGMSVGEMNEATRLNHDHVVIHTIELTTTRRNPELSMLRQFANANRGEYRALNLTSSAPKP